MKFADLDGDNTPELLATDGRDVVLYSISGDSLLFVRQYDTTVQIVRMELADVNRDSIADIVISCCLDYGLPPSRPDDSLWPVICFDGASGFADSACYYLTRDEGVWGDLSFPGALTATDINDDGYNELLLGCTDGSFSGMGGYFLIDGTTRLFYDFPDSLMWTKAFASRELNLVPLADGSDAWVGLLESNFYGEYPGGDRLSMSYCLSRIDSAGVAHFWVDDDLVTTCDPNDDRSELEGQHLGCSGDIDTLDPATDLLTWSYQLVECPPGGIMIDSTRLELRRIVAPNSTVLLWSRDLGNNSVSSFAYLPAFRGYFVGFSVDTLILFSGADGTPLAKTPDQPTGLRSWQDLYGDSDLRLVVADSNQVTFYRLDISTDVTDRDGKTLPISFALGRPYPNPFNAEVTIPLELSSRSEVAVDILDPLGRRVMSLYQGSLASGKNTFRWNAEQAASGVYLVRAQGAGQTRTAKMVLLK